MREKFKCDGRFDGQIGAVLSHDFVCLGKRLNRVDSTESRLLKLHKMALQNATNLSREPVLRPCERSFCYFCDIVGYWSIPAFFGTALLKPVIFVVLLAPKLKSGNPVMLLEYGRINQVFLEEKVDFCMHSETHCYSCYCRCTSQNTLLLSTKNSFAHLNVHIYGATFRDSVVLFLRIL